MADFADDAAEITENYLGWHCRMPESSLGRTRSQASVEIATTLWQRVLSALVENAETTISGERYKAGKEKPRTGAILLLGSQFPVCQYPYTTPATLPNQQAHSEPAGSCQRWDAAC